MFYERMQSVALRLLTKFGTQAVITVTETTEDDITGEILSESAVDFVTVGVSRPMSKSYVDSEVIEYGDTDVILSAKDCPVPKIGAKIKHGSNEYKVISIKEVSPAITSLVYFCHCRN